MERMESSPESLIIGEQAIKRTQFSSGGVFLIEVKFNGRQSNDRSGLKRQVISADPQPTQNPHNFHKKLFPHNPPVLQVTSNFTEPGFVVEAATEPNASGGPGNDKQPLTEYLGEQWQNSLFMETMQ
eukprot:scaffold20210_cov103-Cylindrotheca_fusiformis.AAC.1